jgi:ATP-dependent Clp protease adaptor protein ClpS
MYSFDNMTKTESALDVLLEETLQQQIVLFNDDVNTFDWVIESLIEVCSHEAIQAEQCALLVHTKGKCAVKKGEYDSLKPMCTSLLERGLSAEIQ